MRMAAPIPARPVAPPAPSAPPGAIAPPLAGLEPGDPRSTLHLLRIAASNTATALPKLVKRHWWQLLILAAGWVVLMTVDIWRLKMSYPRWMPLWNLLGPILSLLVFLTAAYNNFVAKTVYATLLFRVGLPMFQRLRREGWHHVAAGFRSLVPSLKENWSQAGVIARALFIAFAGIGLAFSNFLTRNNMIDKYLVSFVLALSLIKALGDGSRSIPFMTARVAGKDFFSLMRRPSPVRNHHLYVSISGVVAGLLGAFVLAFIARGLGGIGGKAGYLLGVVAVLAAIALHLAGGRPGSATKAERLQAKS